MNIWNGDIMLVSHDMEQKPESIDIIFSQAEKDKPRVEITVVDNNCTFTMTNVTLKSLERLGKYCLHVADAIRHCSTVKEPKSD